MKTFEQILSTTQDELKKYLVKFLRSYKYEVIEGDGYVYAKGNLPVLVTAHMDRHPCQDERVKEIIKEPIMNKSDEMETRWSSPNGICGDDRCGVWIIMNIIKSGLTPSVLFCEDEEKGCKGSSKFTKTEYIKNLGVNYMIQIDRRGKNDAVFYSCDNKEFTKWIEKTTGYKEATGSCSDISFLMPSSEIAGVNFSCGYYNEHTKNEYIVIEEMNRTMNMIIDLLKVESVPYKYERKYYSSASSYGYNRNSLYNWDDYEYNNYGGYYSSKKSTPKRKNTKVNFNFDTLVKLECVLDEEFAEIYGDTIRVSGNTKPECWMNLFMTYDDLTYSGIVDYKYH